MSLSILNNIAALYAQNNLTSTSSKLQSTLQQLSSGSRINSGADDPAGLAVSDGLGANEAALTQSAQNATSGIGLLQTADGALSQVTSLLDRAVTLATEASNGTLTPGQVSSANQEYQNILTQIGNIGQTTNFNSSDVFSGQAKDIVVTDGTEHGVNTYADTVGTLSTSSVGTQAPAAASIVETASNPTTPTDLLGASTTLTFGSATDTLGGSFKLAVGSGDATSVTITSGSSLSDAATQIGKALGNTFTVAQGTDAAANTIVITGPEGDTNDITVSNISITDTPPQTPGAGQDFTASGVASLDATTAPTVLTTVTSAIADVAYQRGTIGADINELTSASNVASSESVNLTSAQDSITATDYGQAASNLSKYQILSQTGISALAQANSVQQEVLKLLQ